MYDLSEIKEYLSTKYIGQTIIQFDELKSTGAKAKSIFDTCPNGTVILSEHQTKCKLRFGREWYSCPDKNIYLSIILKPEADKYIISEYETIASATVLESIRYFYNSSSIKIKWPNDILIDNKKISSVHCELVKSKNIAAGIIITICVNVNLDYNQIDDEIKKRSTSIKIETNTELNREKLAGIILNNLEAYCNELIIDNSMNNPLNIFIHNSEQIGKSIEIVRYNKKTARSVLVKGIENNGNLIVINDKGNEETINSGEVTVKYEERA